MDVESSNYKNLEAQAAADIKTLRKNAKKWQKSDTKYWQKDVYKFKTRQSAAFFKRADKKLARAEKKFDKQFKKLDKRGTKA